MNCPRTGLRGTRFRKRMGWKKRSYFRYFLISVSSGSRLARILPCVITTPRGSAVVPEVKIISSVELRRNPGGAYGLRGWCATTSGRSSSASAGKAGSSGGRSREQTRSEERRAGKARRNGLGAADDENTH